MSPDDALSRFRRFLTDCWPVMLEFANEAGWDDDPYFLDRWQQANWEILVERRILGPGEYLRPYGYGGDNPDLRHTEQNSQPSHKLVCFDRLEAAAAGAHDFCCFETVRDGRYTIDTPFDFISMRNQKTRKIKSLPIAQVGVRIEPIVEA
jgi:hypothetical protein